MKVHGRRHVPLQLLFWPLPAEVVALAAPLDGLDYPHVDLVILACAGDQNENLAALLKSPNTRKSALSPLLQGTVDNDLARRFSLK
jgi:hypothetical protein